MLIATVMLDLLLCALLLAVLVTRDNLRKQIETLLKETQRLNALLSEIFREEREKAIQQIVNH